MPSVPKFVLGREPEKAMEYLRERKLLVGKVKLKNLQDSALARAVTIAKITNLDMTQDIYTSLEMALKEGKSFHRWKTELVAEFRRKGWVVGHDKAISKGIDGTLLADPKTGEYIGTPRRLNTIYRVNTQQAYAAARYQRYMDNVDNRPYWQYSAVGDERTRPAHLALDGRVYRYDDPFWHTFYPPNGFNCRCTVIALDDRALKRNGLEVASSEKLLVKAKYPKDKKGNVETTTGFALPDGRILVTDKGFDYNVGRLTYKPNLDLYAEPLAHQFAKAEMTGAEFKLSYEKFEKAYLAEKAKLGIAADEKIADKQQLILVQNLASMNFHFAAGRLSQSNAELLGTKTSTVWLSDQTLIKQFNSREGQDFGLSDYEVLPDILNNPIKMVLDEKEGWRFYAEINGRRYFAVLKVLLDSNEIFLQSFRLASNKQWKKALGNNH